MAKKPLNPVVVNRSHPLARGLVAAWLLNESPSDVLTCATGNPLNDLIMGVNANWSYNTGEPGIEHDFDTNDPLRSRLPFGADNPASMRGALELSIYARLRYDPGGGGTETIYANGTTTGGAIREGFTLQTFSTDDLYFWNGTISNNFDSGAINYFSGEDGNEVSVAMRWTGSTCRYWKNGQFFADTTIVQQPVSSLPQFAFIGALEGFRYWNDAIYEVFLWNRALSDQEALQLYLDPYVTFEAPRAPDVLFPGAPPTDINLSATLAGDSSVSATLTTEAVDVNLTATLAGDSGLSATLSTVVGEILLGATLGGDSALSATLSVSSADVLLDAALAGDSGVSANLTVEAEDIVSLSATLSGDSSLGADITIAPAVIVALSATCDASSAISADLTVQPEVVVALGATLDGDSNLSGTLLSAPEGIRLLTATLAGDSSIAAPLTVEAPDVTQFDAVLAGESSVSADLTVSPPVLVTLSATLDGDSLVAAPLAVVAPGDVVLFATLQGNSTLIATLAKEAPAPVICNPSIQSCTPVRSVRGSRGQAIN